MTRPRFDQHSTEFGIWIRQQPDLHSKDGYVATNVDYIWCNYRTRKWMLIEEKRFMSKPDFCQSELFAMLEIVSRLIAGKYYGFHVISFENTSPEDGEIYLNGRRITKDQLITFLRFEAPSYMYQTNEIVEQQVRRLLRGYPMLFNLYQTKKRTAIEGGQ